MTIGPRLFPVTVDADDGSLAVSRSLAIISYAGEPLQASRIAVYTPDTQCVLDEPVADLRKGTAPSMVYGRHELTLEDGRILLVLQEHGCGCGSRLRGFNPSFPATSGRRP